MRRRMRGVGPSPLGFEQPPPALPCLQRADLPFPPHNRCLRHLQVSVTALSRTFSSDTYVKMLANPKLTAPQRTKIEQMQVTAVACSF